MKANTKTITRITELEFSREEVEFLKFLRDMVDEIGVNSVLEENDMLVEIINNAIYERNGRKTQEFEKPIKVNVENYYEDY